MTKNSTFDVEGAIATARDRAEGLIDRFEQRFRRDTRRWKLDRADQEFLARITHGQISGRALLSNRHVHRAAQFALIEAAVDAHLAQPDRQWVWITIAWDKGVTWERAPDIDLVSLRNTLSQHIRRCGLDGFGVIEVDVWKNINGEPGRRVVAHGHILATAADGRRLKIGELERQLGQRQALCNTFPGQNVVIRGVTPTPGDFAAIGQYMFKRPAFAKNPIPRADEKYELIDVKHSGGSVTRLTEMMSYCEVGDVIFSIGCGTRIADRVRKAAAEAVKPRRGATQSPTSQEIANHWDRIRATTDRGKNFCACRIVTRPWQRKGQA